MEKLGMEVALNTHTEELIERVEMNQAMFEFMLDDLSDREAKIYEIAYANGYSDATQDHDEGREFLQVQK